MFCRVLILKVLIYSINKTNKTRDLQQLYHNVRTIRRTHGKNHIRGLLKFDDSDKNGENTDVGDNLLRTSNY